jgi:hypothetical protein
LRSFSVLLLFLNIGDLFCIYEESVFDRKTSKNVQRFLLVFIAKENWFERDLDTGEVVQHYPPPAKVTACLTKNTPRSNNWNKYLNIKIISKHCKLFMRQLHLQLV